MGKIRWELEEAVALIDFYLKNDANPNVSKEKLVNLASAYDNRAKKLGLLVNSKFRNLSGLRMQLGCIHYVVTDGREGMSNGSQVFYQAWALYKTEPEHFKQILEKFYQDYDF